MAKSIAIAAMEVFFGSSPFHTLQIHETKEVVVVGTLIIRISKFETIAKIKNKKVRSLVMCCGHMVHICHMTQVQQNEKFICCHSILWL